MEQRGGRARINVCGGKKRLGVLVNEGAGGWEASTLSNEHVYRVTQGDIVR